MAVELWGDYYPCCGHCNCNRDGPSYGIGHPEACTEDRCPGGRRPRKKRESVTG